MMAFPRDWFWFVGGDETRAWSSAAAAYVDAIPEDAGVTHIVSEDELTDVLAVYGLPGPTVRIPESVSARQFKLQLLAAGLLEQVEAFVASQGDDVQIAYDNSGTFVRTEPMMASGFAALGFTPEQVDAFFSVAAKL
ncbi:MULTISPECIES: hypothetical protein [unclassified Mesorhizobium]|uniref:hypothetical protein n=1 Tax=unclassified Mesorhizobium TaxID=325217 RepID=UPI001FE1C4F6|nr:MULTISPECIES: hypothetical protein [unclassified Mesorhizobium]